MARLISPGADPAHKETDRIIAGLEKKLKGVYAEAEKNASEKFSTYMAKFKIKDEAHIADVASGKWSQKQYEDWRKNQLLYADALSEIRDTIAQDLHNADKIAIQMVRDKQSDVYALNHNYGTYEVEHGLGVDTTYTLYDHDTVERLIKDDPQLLPKPSPRKQKEIDAKDIAWNKQKLTSAFTASILSGDSIPKMAQKISEVAEMDNHAAIRNARTMCTGAENAGRINSYKRAQGMGIKMKQEWMATLDSRTRDSHRMVDGEIIEVGKKFSNGCRFPGDPEAPAREVYNCRCTMVAVVNGVNPGAFDKTDTLRRKLENATITYDEWKNEHKRTNYAKVFTIPDSEGRKPAFTSDDIRNELNKTSVGKQTLDYLNNNANIKLVLNYDEPYGTARGMQDGDRITLNIQFIGSLLVAAQTLAHETTHHRFKIGGCQKAEAICMAYEKMLKENRTYLYDDEWEYVKKLAEENYNLFPWESGGIGKVEEYVRIVKRPKQG